MLLYLPVLRAVPCASFLTQDNRNRIAITDLQHYGSAFALSACCNGLYNYVVLQSSAHELCTHPPCSWAASAAALPKVRCACRAGCGMSPPALTLPSLCPAAAQAHREPAAQAARGHGADAGPVHVLLPGAQGTPKYYLANGHILFPGPDAVCYNLSRWQPPP